MSVSSLPNNRSQIVQLNTNFNKSLKAGNFMPSLSRTEVAGFELSDAQGAIAIVGSPTVALALSDVHEAAKSAADAVRAAGNAELADDILTKLGAAIDGAFSTIDAAAADFGPEDAGYDAALAKLAEQL